MSFPGPTMIPVPAGVGCCLKVCRFLLKACIFIGSVKASMRMILELVVLPNVLALALHQVNYFGWMDKGDHSWYQTILLLKVRVD